MQAAELEFKEPRRFVITGGAGFIGRFLAKRLTQTQSGTVLAVDRFHQRSEGAGFAVEQQVSFLDQYIWNRDALAESFRGCEVVVHLAAESSVVAAQQDPVYTFEKNVGGTFNVMRAARSAGVKRGVLTYSKEVYGSPERIPCLNPLRCGQSIATTAARRRPK